MYLVSTYTHQVKSYCDVKFFKRFNELDADKIIVDNTQGLDYARSLQERFCDNVHHLEISGEDYRFQRSVCDSANYVRDYFLDGGWDYLVILESDVIVPRGLLNLFDEAIAMAENWAAIGGYYHTWFHTYDKWGTQPYENKRCKSLKKTQHVLSGCTVYSRNVMERLPFRWSLDDVGAFPDAWICHDVNKFTNMNLYDYPKIICTHEHNEKGERH